MRAASGGWELRPPLSDKLRCRTLAIWLVGPRVGNLAFTIAGWSSSVARWAHNPEVAGSNPVPATM